MKAPLLAALAAAFALPALAQPAASPEPRDPARAEFRAAAEACRAAPTPACRADLQARKQAWRAANPERAARMDARMEERRTARRAEREACRAAPTPECTAAEAERAERRAARMAERGQRPGWPGGPRTGAPERGMTPPAPAPMR